MSLSLVLPSFFLTVALVLCASVARFVLSTLRPAGFPPGPPIIPGLGNIHQLPWKKGFLTFESWSRQYGPMLGLKFGPVNVVVLHRAEQVYELFEKRGARYAGRPKFAIPCDYVFTGEWEHYPAFMDLAFQRSVIRACKRHLGPAGLAESDPVQRAVALELLRSLLLLPAADTAGFQRCFHHWALGSALALICGRRPEDLGEGWPERYHHLQQGLLEMVEPGGGAPPIDIFPFLAWVPTRWAQWKTKAAIVRRGIYETYDAMLALAQQQQRERGSAEGTRGRYEPLMVRLLRERDEAAQAPVAADGDGQKSRPAFSSRDIALIGGGLLDGATDSTVGTALYMVQTFAVHRDAQRRAQAEVDAYFQSRAPTSAPSAPLLELIDAQRLPFLSACLKEVLRWRPPTPSAVPRETVADDGSAFGYRIPRGTMVIINVWAMQHDPQLYDRPDEFDPERFLKHPLGLKPGADADAGNASSSSSWRKPVYVFGAGRRACPGEGFAMRSLLNTFASLLWVFDIVPAGEMDMSVETGMHEGASVSPNPFHVRFEVRSEEARKGLLEQYRRAEQVLKEHLSTAAA